MTEEYFPPEYFPPNYFPPNYSGSFGLEIGYGLMHRRAAIRQAVVDLLIAAGTDAGSRVFDTHSDPVVEAEIPCIVVFGLREEVEREDITRAGLRLRKLELAIKATVDIQDREHFGRELDDMAEQIETVIDANPLLNQTAETVWFERSEFGILKGEKLGGIVYLTYSVEYRG